MPPLSSPGAAAAHLPPPTSPPLRSRPPPTHPLPQHRVLPRRRCSPRGSRRGEGSQLQPHQILRPPPSTGRRDRLLPIDSNTEDDEIGPGLTEDATFFQEEGLEGTFVIDLGVDLDNSAAVLSDEIVDEKELEVLERQLDDSQEIVEEDYGNNDTDEEPDADYVEEDY